MLESNCNWVDENFPNFQELILNRCRRVKSKSLSRSVIENTFYQLAMIEKKLSRFWSYLTKNKNIIQKLITESNLFYFLFQIDQVQSGRSSVRLNADSLQKWWPETFRLKIRSGRSLIGLNLDGITKVWPQLLCGLFKKCQTIKTIRKPSSCLLMLGPSIFISSELS